MNSMSMFTSVKALRNRQQPLTNKSQEFITGLPILGVSELPLPSARKGIRQEQIRKEVGQP